MHATRADQGPTTNVKHSKHGVDDVHVAKQLSSVFVLVSLRNTLIARDVGNHTQA